MIHPSMYPKFFESRKIRILVLCLSILVLYLNLWESGARVKAQGVFSFKGRRTHYTLPFQFNRNLIIIPIMINNQGPYQFIFDTGVSILVITNPYLGGKLGIESKKNILIRGFGNGEDISANIISGLDLKIGPISGKGFDAAVLPPGTLNFSNYIGKNIDGIIGYDLVKDFRMKINIDNSVIQFEKPTKPFKKRNYTSIPIEMDGSQAFIKVDVLLNGKKIPLKLVLDTGGGNSVFINLETLSPVPDHIKGFFSNLGWGINGTIQGIISRIDLLSLDSLKIKNVICAFPQFKDTARSLQGINGNGNLGNEILRRFNLVIDYNHNKIF